MDKTSDELWRERIVWDPLIAAGRPTIKGTRITVEFVLELLSQGWQQQDILENYPTLSLEDIRACFSMASESVAQSGTYLKTGT